MPSLEILEIAQLNTILDCLFSMIFCLWIFFPNKGFVRKIFSFFSFGNYFLKFSALFFSHDKFRCQPRKAISYQFFFAFEAHIPYFSGYLLCFWRNWPNLLFPLQIILPSYSVYSCFQLLPPLTTENESIDFPTSYLIISLDG